MAAVADQVVGVALSFQGDARLAVATGLKWLWPDHHLYWVAFTVALLSSRQGEVLSAQTVQRAGGTAVGVIGTASLLSYWPPVWALVVGLIVLASVLPLLRAGNYLAYSTFMTPIVIAIMDSGQQVDPGVLADRLVATIVGAGLVVGANWLFRKASPPSSADRAPRG